MTAVPRHRFALALLFVVGMTLFIAPLAKREVFTFRDHLDYFQPLRWFTAVELRDARLPLWNPYSASGEPWLANPQTGVFYPPAWLMVVLPFETGYVLFLALHVIVLGWGSYLLFERSASRGAALVGAFAVMCSGPVFSLLDVSNNLATFAWIPLALWCAAERAWRRGALVLALAFLGGEPFFAGIAAVLYAIFGLLAPSTEPKSARVAAVGGAGLAALGLSAIQLFPFLDSLRDSDRAAGLGESLILSQSMPLRDWLRVVIPPPGASTVDPHLGQQFIPIVYVGISVALLALAGLTTLRQHRDVAGWLAILAVTAFVASGPAFLAHLPLTLLRYPARLLPFAALAIAALAARGWERIRPDRRWLDLVIVLVILVDLVPRMRPLLASAPFQRDPIPYAASIGATSKVLHLGAESNRGPAWIAGYLNLYDRRFDAFTASPVISEAYVREYRHLLETRDLTQLASLGVEYVVTRRELPEPFTPVARNGDIQIYRTPASAPMAALFWREPMTIRPARWELDTSQARVTIDAPHDGVLVLRQRASRGWTATVDGMPAKSLVIDRLFRGVMLARGHHEVIWRYRAPLLRIGAIATLVTLIAMQLPVFVKCSRE